MRIFPPQCNTKISNHIISNMKYVTLNRYEELLDAARKVTWAAFLAGAGIGATVAALIVGGLWL
jgi:hypothetical protein